MTSNNDGKKSNGSDSKSSVSFWGGQGSTYSDCAVDIFTINCKSILRVKSVSFFVSKPSSLKVEIEGWKVFERSNIFFDIATIFGEWKNISLHSLIEAILRMVVE